MKLRSAKCLLVVLLFIVKTYTSQAQTTEFYFNALSGLFNYSGPGAANTSTAAFDGNRIPKWSSESPYGKKLNFGFVLELNATKVLENDFLIGTGFGFQQFYSKTKFDSVVTNGVIRQIFAATGEARLNNIYLNLRPFVGKRLIFKDFLLDVELGTDLAWCISSKESGSITGETGNTVTYENKPEKPAVDVRPTLGIKLQAKKVGVLIRYAKGLSNYKDTYGQNAHSNFIGLGLSFSLQ